MSEVEPVLTEPQRRALAALVDLSAHEHGGYVSPRQLAHTLWPDSPAWNRRTRRHSTPAGGALGATMPMKAGSMLWRLHGLGLASGHPDLGRNLWMPTVKGRALVTGAAKPAERRPDEA